MINEDRISLPELADELQCHKQSLFKIVKKLGLNPIKQRDPERGNQLVATVTPDEALQIRREILTRARVASAIDPEGSELLTDSGQFYLIQLEPQHDPGRIKLGFTTDLEERLRKHRCSAPFSQVLATWPCRSIWERTAMDCVAFGLEQLHTEVFRASSLEEVTDRANKFFALMPPVSNPKEDAIDPEVGEPTSIPN